MSRQFGNKNSTELFAKAMRAADYGTRKPKTRSLMSAGVTLGLMVAVGGVLWYSYPKDEAVQDKTAVPMVRADAAPVKTIPDDPGGMEIPYRDSTVFNALKEADAGEAIEAKKIENLLPESEKPLERDEIFARMEAEMVAEAEAQRLAEPKVIEQAKVEHEVIKPQIDPSILAKLEKGETVAVKVAPVEAQKVASKTEVKPETKPVKISVVDPVTGEKKQAVKVVVAEGTAEAAMEDTITLLAKEIAKTEPATGTEMAEPVKITEPHFVQLGSVMSEDGAEKEWKRIQAAYKDVLADMGHRIEKADLGERGTYYRIQGGPLTAETASTVCDAITAKKPGGCLVVKP